MKNILLLTIVTGLLTAACQSKKETSTNMTNPFFTEYATPFQVPPFDQIKLEHYLPAIDSGIAQQEAEIKAIVENPQEPDFANTILAYVSLSEKASSGSSIILILV